MIAYEEIDEVGLIGSSKDPCGFKRQLETLGLLKIRSDLGLKTFESDGEKALGLYKNQIYDLTLSFYFDMFIRFILPDIELFLRKRLSQVVGKDFVPEAYLKKLKKDLATFFSNKLELYSKYNNLQKKAVKRSVV